uniref:NF-X1-type zinc finger protein NFXL2 n=1 Tax=Anthurium amnicola TaxID=1678845 RepID=A0A1D1Z7N7_9ARAE
MDSRAFPPLVSPPVAVDAAVFSDSDTCSSGGDEPAEQVAAVEDTVFSAYLQASGTSPGHDLAKIRSFLASSSKGSFVACLICLERIRPPDPAWSCSSGCYAFFHLICIQSWARQCSSLPSSSSRPSSALPVDWHCPKCRLNYPHALIPRVYLCFCGKVENPQPDPWIVPHSCGEICGRPLRGNCGHECLLLCHPGPCPPCPKLVTARCFCGSTEDVRRCALKEFSCNRPCARLLECRTHRCLEKCHEGPCPPCLVKGTYRCLCGKEEVERECHERQFRCERPCGGVLNCGKHACSRGCHAGLCGNCPLQGRRTCPCGKKEYQGVACDATVPTCGSTCEKILSCNIHRCPERCHQGPCVETCRNVLVKFCRCGGLKKEVPCYQDLICERKCQNLRDCGRHACKRRCCDGNCPPCPEICGRKLRCNNHKCPSPCHRGVCAPCPLMISISCACGETHFEVPCGTEKEQKPPRCSKPCHISRLCRHSSVSKPHKCHYGACPFCRMICQEQLPCGHTCKLRCHGPVPPPNPDFSLRPKKKKRGRHIESTPGSPCPPCQEVVWSYCLGKHIGEDKPMLCSSQVRFSCQNLCGNPLGCGNHYCTKPCHALKHKLLSGNLGRRQPDDDTLGLAEPCEQCFLPCQKVCNYI